MWWQITQCRGQRCCNKLPASTNCGSFSLSILTYISFSPLFAFICCPSYGLFSAGYVTCVYSVSEWPCNFADDCFCWILLIITIRDGRLNGRNGVPNPWGMPVILLSHFASRMINSIAVKKCTSSHVWVCQSVCPVKYNQDQIHRFTWTQIMNYIMKI